MWRNYVTVGIRALAKSRTYAFINIFGLAIGMAACLMILLYVRYEFSYDRWIPESESVYQVQSWYKSRRDRPGSPAPDDALMPRPQVAQRQISRRSSARSMSPTPIRSSSRTARRRRPRTISGSTATS